MRLGSLNRQRRKCLSRIDPEGSPEGTESKGNTGNLLLNIKSYEPDSRYQPS